ncbi:zinc finger BED domain-containing protein RICESLEEPER 1-like [Quercus robur]|uniref:zinc finger BED domain-containing protein RICESLEEPER 1-like n=1 Tax=Quercus robur TaxID=38942 RepID=UPI00216385D9|nr:zinc finger BED domain-containing protein RICESLEEPER 1-like [Quercus robur]
MNGEEGFQLVPTAFTVEASRKALTEMIIIDELPFRFVEGYGFQRYSTTLQSKLQIRDIPSHQTVARDVISIYGVEREKLREALKGRRVCLTMDTWTMDNASSNGTTIKFLQTVTKDWKGTVLEHEFLHMRCCAHILNLIVGDGLKEIDASIARVREAVRWNSTYLILDIAEKFEKVFLRKDFEDDSYSSYFLNKENSVGLGSPCGVDFQNCRTFVGFLKLFNNATKKFSDSLYVTSNTFFDEMFMIQENIAHLIKSQNHLLKNMATKMEAKFEKYWGKGDKINKLLYVAVVLDPRKKMRFLKFSFSEIYGDEVADEMVDLVRNFMDRLNDDYSRVDSPNVVLPSENGRTHMEGNTIGCSDPYVMVNSRYERFLEAENIGCSNEIEKYLAENCESRRDVKFEILGWWKANSDRYQELSKMAKDYRRAHT